MRLQYYTNLGSSIQGTKPINQSVNLKIIKVYGTVIGINSDYRTFDKFNEEHSLSKLQYKM